MSRVRALWLASMMGLSLVRCGAAESTMGVANEEGRNHIRIATWSEGGGPEAQIQGEIVADPELGCVWMKRGEERIATVWPDGYRLDRDPVRVVDPHGETAARAGEYVVAAGGNVNVATDDAGIDFEAMPPPCRTGDRMIKVSYIGAKEPSAPTTE